MFQRSSMFSSSCFHRPPHIFAPVGVGLFSVAAAARHHESYGSTARQTPQYHKFPENLFTRLEDVAQAILHSCGQGGCGGLVRKIFKVEKLHEMLELVDCCAC
jgi:hypothetical protein